MRRRWTVQLANHLSFEVMFWPVFSLALLVGLWSLALMRGGEERARMESDSLAEVGAAAQAYEQYVTRSVANMDQVSMQLKQSWEQSGGRLQLDAMVREGMFLDSAFACVAIVDAYGALRSAIRPQACGTAFDGAAFFLYHQGNNASALRIGAPEGASGGAHDTIVFSRRLDRADGEFDGAVLVTVRSGYFTNFYLPATLRGGLVAAAGAESALRVEQDRQRGAPDASALPANAALWAGQSGALVVQGPHGFPDGSTRVLGWHRSPVYPLVGLVAVSHAQAMGAYTRRWADLRRNALMGSVLIVLLGGAATNLARRAHLRHRTREDVRLAYRTATEGGNDGFYMASPLYDAQGRLEDFEIVDCNERGARFYGIGRQALIGRRLSSMDTGRGSGGSALFEAYRLAMETGFHEDERLMPEHNRLNITWGKRRIVRVGDALAITLQDVSERKAHLAELKRLSDEDILTGLPNRQWLTLQFPQLLVQAQRCGSGVALLYIDLDEFRHVNDVHGDSVGDALLQGAAQRLKSLLRPSDCVVRFGGDEFVVLLMPPDSDAHAELVAARIVEAFCAPFALGRTSVAVGASVGIAVFPHDAGDAAALVKNGAVAMDAAKSEGKGRYRRYDPALALALHEHANMKRSLLDAIEHDQFVLYYQPRVDAVSGELCSMEALVRWIHPQRGLVPPLDFIPLAEASGLILQIGELVMEKACAQLGAWRVAGLALVPVSINVSPSQFARGEVHRQLQLCLARHAISPALLEVEITESAMMGDQDHIIAQLAAIRALGVKLHVDDFGTGYSSLSQLQKLKMDVLKVDRAFTAELGQSREGQVFFQAIVSMAHALGMDVVAEGVETAAQLRILQELQCNEVQGYFIARPMPASAMAELMQSGMRFAGAADMVC